MDCGGKGDTEAQLGTTNTVQRVKTLYLKLYEFCFQWAFSSKETFSFTPSNTISVHIRKESIHILSFNKRQNKKEEDIQKSTRL
jgi:hypothetical protein